MNLKNPFGILWCTWGCSSWMWTEIWDDVRNPLSDVISDSVFRRSNLVFASQKILIELYLMKTEFDLLKTESEMTSLRGFLTSSQILVHIQLLHPQVHHRIPKGLYKPRERYQAEIVLPPSFVWDGFKYIFTMMDHFTKYWRQILLNHNKA